jgi:hypothetical protein
VKGSETLGFALMVLAVIAMIGLGLWLGTLFDEISKAVRP